MRQPTPDPYAWHRHALQGDYETIPSYLDEPQAGWFKTRMVKQGPWVPARIWLTSFTDEHSELTEDEQFWCEVNGSPRDADWQWPWLCFNPISEAEYNYMMAVQEWAHQHAPSEPEANPRQKVDWMTIRPPSTGALRQ